LASSITGTSVTRGGGGGGASYQSASVGAGGAGGGGSGGNYGGTFLPQGTDGAANTGGGGGGNGDSSVSIWGRSGGSGVVIIRYLDAYPLASATTGSPTITTTGGYRIYTFTASGSITF
jgi:hypothetical protein